MTGCESSERVRCGVIPVSIQVDQSVTPERQDQAHRAAAGGEDRHVKQLKIENIGIDARRGRVPDNSEETKVRLACGIRWVLRPRTDPSEETKSTPSTMLSSVSCLPLVETTTM